MSQDRWHIPASDKELIEVFVEEVGDLLRSIDHHMRSWESNPGDRKILTEVRRSFHTLKGSGRMVKALDLSELAWRVERMLNQAIAGTVAASDAMVMLVASVRGQIPGMVDAFKYQRPVAGSRDIENLIRVADALAAGKTPLPVEASRAATGVGGEKDRKPQQLTAGLKITMQRADEALHRSEMALQLARHLTLQIESQHRPDQRDYGRELDRIGEIVNRLSKDVTDLRREPKQSRNAPPSGQDVTSPVVGPATRVGASLVQDQLLSPAAVAFGEERQADTAPRRFGWWALVVSALVGGAIATGLIMLIRFST